MTEQPNRIVVAGSSANPPHIAHRAFVKYLIDSDLFDLVIWSPCGKRCDKKNLISADDRVAMTILSIADLLNTGKLVIRFNSNSILQRYCK